MEFVPPGKPQGIGGGNLLAFAAEVVYLLENLVFPFRAQPIVAKVEE
jgi:hypothetical protein